ncbi:3-isopropylmalate dehydrogenase [Aliikangiella sp. IMCC44632]
MTRTKKIAWLAGDGIGPEVTLSAKSVVKAVSKIHGVNFQLFDYYIGGAAIEHSGKPLPDQTLQGCIDADAVFLGAIGGPKWDALPTYLRPEQGLLKLRKALNVFANIRPIKIHPNLINCSPLKPSKLESVDFVIVRELTGGIYFGNKYREGDSAFDQCSYSVTEIERVARVACELAMQRNKIITSVDKANVLETSRLWREVTSRLVKNNYPEITLEHQLVDSCAMKLIQNPSQFDVILTENMFGDILSDEASVLVGSLGMLASTSVGTQHGIFEPAHGSAPDIAGSNLANPYAAILSCAMMLRWLNHEALAVSIETAVAIALDAKIFTQDLNQSSSLLTTEVTQAVISYLK